MSAAPHTPETAPGITVATGNADETRALGARLTRLLRAGDLVMLSGGLGAGKTTLAQGIGAALEVRDCAREDVIALARAHAVGDAGRHRGRWGCRAASLACGPRSRGGRVGRVTALGGAGGQDGQSSGQSREGNRGPAAVERCHVLRLTSVVLF